MPKVKFQAYALSILYSRYGARRSAVSGRPSKMYGCILISAAFDILSMFVMCIVLALSFMSVKHMLSIGPRVFAVNCHGL